jgi:hypothetical protein
MSSGSRRVKRSDADGAERLLAIRSRSLICILVILLIPAFVATERAEAACRETSFLNQNDSEQALETYVTSLGGSENDIARAVLVRPDHSVLVVGHTRSPGFASSDEKMLRGTSDIFVGTVSIDGQIEKVRYFGGNGSEHLASAVLDRSGYLYLAGTTTSTDFSFTAGESRSGPSDAFLMKISPDLERIEWLRLIGGSDTDLATALALNGEESVLVVGETASFDFPSTSSAPAGFAGGSSDAFVVEIAADGQLLFAMTLGGRSTDGARAVGVRDGLVYIAGMTRSPDFPLLQPLQESLAGGADFFVTSIDPKRQEVLFSTYLGGSENDSPRALAIDTFGSIWIGGNTYSFDFPGIDRTQSKEGLGSSGILVRMARDGSTVELSTLLGGTGSDFVTAVAVDSSSNIAVAGTTSSPNFPESPPSEGEGSTLMTTDAFLVLVSRDGAELSPVLRFQGEGDRDEIHAISLSALPIIHVAGSTDSSSFGTGTATALVTGGGIDSFVSRIRFFDSLEVDHVLAIPVVGRLSGAAGSEFRTDLQMTNLCQSTINGEIIFRSAGGERERKIPFALRTKQTIVVRDVLEWMGEEGLGTIDIFASSHEIDARAYLYHQGPEGDLAGTWVRAVPPDELLQVGDRGVVIVPSDLTGTRMNIGVRALDEEAALRVVVRAADGTVVQDLLKSVPARTLLHQPAEAFLEVTPGESSSIAFSVVSGRAIAYLATTDNVSNDPAVHLARPTRLLSERSFFPVAGLSAVGPSLDLLEAETILQLHNPHSMVIRGTIAPWFFSQLYPEFPTIDYEIQTGETVVFDQFDGPTGAIVDGQPLPPLLSAIDIEGAEGEAPLAVMQLVKAGHRGGKVGFSIPSVTRLGKPFSVVRPPSRPTTKFLSGVYLRSNSAVNAVLLTSHGTQKQSGSIFFPDPNFVRLFDFFPRSKIGEGDRLDIEPTPEAFFYGFTIDSGSGDIGFVYPFELID